MPKEFFFCIVLTLDDVGKKNLAIQSMDDSFGNEILGSGALNTFIQVVTVGTTLAEKGTV